MFIIMYTCKSTACEDADNVTGSVLCHHWIPLYDLGNMFIVRIDDLGP